MADSLDVTKWIRRTKMDLDMASNEAARFRPPIEGVCFLCQQAAEKILKAYTIAKTGARTKSHDLENLINECGPYSADFDNIRETCADLSPYISIARYPPDIEPTEYDMKQAVKDAAMVMDFTIAKLKELGYEGVPEQNMP